MKNIQRIYTHNALPDNEYLVEHRVVDINGNLSGYISHVEISNGVITHISILAMWDITGPGLFDYELDVIWGEPTNKLLSVATIGDIVVISTTGRTMYHIYRNGSYVLNQSTSDLPQIELGITTYSDPDSTPEEAPVKQSWQEAISAYLQYKRERKDDYDEYEGHLFLVAAYRMEDNTVIRHSLPFYHPLVYNSLISPRSQTSTNPGIRQFKNNNGEIQYKMLSYFTTKAKYYINHTIEREWAEVIKSIDIYAMYIPQVTIPDTVTFLTEEVEDVKFTHKDLEKEFKSGVFYKIDSVEVVRPDSGDIQIDQERNVILKNLENKESLAPDQLSMHELCFARNMTYNGRIHMADITTYLFEGYRWTIPFMDWQNENNRSYIKNLCGLITVNQGRRSSLPHTVETADFDVINSDMQPLMAVMVQTDDGDRVVYTELDSTVKITRSTTSGEYFLLLPKVFTYPHPGAKSFRVYLRNSNKELYLIKEGQFTQHEMYSFGYHICDDQAISFNPLTSYLYETSELGEWRPVHHPNRLQLSGLENPFYHPAINSYRIGEDKYNQIYDMVIQSTPTSEGQFGEYPLVVFSNSGIYLVTQGQGGVVYASVVSISNLQISGGSIGVDGAVLFSTKHDLYVLQGRIPKLLSRHIIGNTTYNTENTNTLENPITNPIDGLTFIQNLKMGYDSQYKEIVIVNPNHSHHYRFSPEGMYFTMAEGGMHDFVVKRGTYQGYVISGSDKNSLTIYDMGEDSSSITPIRVYFKTNPQNLGHLEFKKIMRLGYYAEGETDGFLNFFTFGENRPENTFPVIQYAKLGEGKDFMFLISGRSPYSVRYFIFMLSGEVVPESMFHHIEADVVPVLPGRIR